MRILITNRIMQWSVCLLAMLALLTAMPLRAQEVGITNDVHIGTLDNGLKYYIHPNAKPSKKLELRLVVNAGSLQETETQRGIAHFTEHMLFNGTRSYPKNTLVDRLESMGIAFGADLNAYTSFDETVYILPVPTENRANVGEGFKILKEWAGDALLTDEDIDAERGIVLEESRLSKSSDRRMYEQYLPKLFNHTLYADRLPIGLDKVISEAPYSEFRSFYKTWYRPDLMAVIAVGDITVEEAEALIKKYFGQLENPANPQPRMAVTLPPYEKNEAMVLTDVEATGYNTTVYFSPHQTDRPLSIQTYRSNIIKGLFINALNRRLAELKEQPKPPFAAGDVDIDDYIRGYEGLIVDITPADDMKSAITAVLTEVSRMYRFGITPEELETGKKMMLAAVQNQLKEKDATASGTLVSLYISHFLNQTPVEGQELRFGYYNQMLPNISVAEVNKEIRQWMDIQRTFLAVMTGPDSKQMPLLSEKETVRLIQEVLKKEVTPYVARETKEALVNVGMLELQKGSITKETYDKELDVTYYELANGVKVALKSTRYKNDEIILTADNYGGTSRYNTEADPSPESAFFASLLLDQLGYGDFTPSELGTYMAGKNASVALKMDAVSNQVHGSATVQDLETMMQLLHLKLTALRKDRQQFESFVNTFKKQLAILDKDPETAFMDTLVRAFYNNSRLAPIIVPNEQMLHKMDLDKIYAIYEASFKNAAADFFYVFTGNIDKSVFEKYMLLYLGSLPASGEQTMWVDNGVRPVQGFNELEYHAGVEDKAVILQIIHGKIDYSQDLQLKASMLTEILNFKIMEEVREKLGVIYGGGFSINIEKVPYQNYQILLQLPCGPANVDTILYTVQAELTKLRKEGITRKDLDKVVANYMESYRTSLESNYDWSRRILNINRWEHDKERFLDFPDVLAKITVNDIKATANLLLGGVSSNIFMGVLYPRDYKK